MHEVQHACVLRGGARGGCNNAERRLDVSSEHHRNRCRRTHPGLVDSAVVSINQDWGGVTDTPGRGDEIDGMRVS